VGWKLGGDGEGRESGKEEERGREGIENEGIETKQSWARIEASFQKAEEENINTSIRQARQHHPRSRRRDARRAQTQAVHLLEGLKTSRLRHLGQLVLDQVLDSLDIVVGGERGAALGATLELCGLDPDGILVREIDVDLQSLRLSVELLRERIRSRVVVWRH
jgi:hypothetical protein